MSIRNKLLAAFGGVVLLAAAVAMYGNWIAGRSGKMIVELYDGPLMAVSHAGRAQASFAQAYRTAEHALVVQDMSSASSSGEFEKAIEQFRADMKIVGERLPKENSGGQVDTAITSADEWAKMVMTRTKAICTRWHSYVRLRWVDFTLRSINSRPSWRTPDMMPAPRAGRSKAARTRNARVVLGAPRASPNAALIRQCA